MNRARLAAARAKMHEALDEILDAIEDAGAPAPAESSSEVQPSKRVKAQPRPLTDIDRARARKSLRKLGLDLP